MCMADNIQSLLLEVAINRERERKSNSVMSVCVRGYHIRALPGENSQLEGLNYSQLRSVL